MEATKEETTDLNHLVQAVKMINLSKHISHLPLKIKC